MNDLRDRIRRIARDALPATLAADTHADWVADAIIAALPDLVSDLHTAAEPMKWVYGIFKTTDDDNGPREGFLRKLHSWRSGGFLIIQQDIAHGLYLLKTTNGLNQSAHPNLNAAKSAAAVVAAITGVKT